MQRAQARLLLHRQSSARMLLVCWTGMNKISDEQMALAEKQIKMYESMINSMTPKEREQPELLAATPSRRRRIARGSGRKEVDVSNLIGRFTAARSMVQNYSKMMKMQGARGESPYPMQLAVCVPPSRYLPALDVIQPPAPLRLPVCIPSLAVWVLPSPLPCPEGSSGDNFHAVVADMLSDTCVAGMPGMPSMTQDEMLAATLAGSGPKKVSKGKVRRKKGASRGFAELAGLRR